MGLRWEFSWPKLWERKGHRCTGLPRTLICTVRVSSLSQLSAVRALESIYKRSLWLCLFVGKCTLYASRSWLAETAARNQPCITESAHPAARAHLCPGEAGLGPHHAREGGTSGTGAGAHSSWAEREVELQAGKVCDIRVTAEFILQQALACFSCLIVLVIVVKCRCYAMAGLVTLATANSGARNHL